MVLLSSRQPDPTGRAITFANVERLVPLIYVFPDRVLRRLPRLLKSHECFDLRYPRVVYIVRDPRDVAVSFYYYNLKVRVIPEGYSMDRFVDRFVAANIVGYADSGRVVAGPCSELGPSAAMQPWQPWLQVIAV